MWRRAWPAALAVPAALAAALPVAPRVYTPAEARSDYIEHCGGCHGVAGTSAPARVPELRGRVGYFLCTPEGRAYLVRLPNVAHAPLADPAALAALLNFVVFDLGAGSAPRGAAPYSGAEVAPLRRDPLVRISLARERARLVAAIRRRCPATPASLARYDAGPATAPRGTD